MDVILVCVVMAVVIAAVFYLVLRKEKPRPRVYPRDPIARQEAKMRELKQRLGLTKGSSSPPRRETSRPAEPDTSQSSFVPFFEAADYTSSTTSSSSSSSSYAEAPDTTYSGSSYGGDSYGGDCGGSDGGSCGGD